MNPFTILHVEDDVDDRDFVRTVLNRSGYDLRIVEAHDGREALRYLGSGWEEKNPPDLILLDLNLPVVDGREILPFLKQEPVTAAIPVVVYTTSSAASDEQFCKNFQVDMLTKPFSHRDAREIIRWIVGQHYPQFRPDILT